MGSGTIFNIQRYSTQDGPGIRTTVFFKGCPLRCLWCHNPEGLSPDLNLAIHQDRCIQCGGCETVCPKGGPFCPGNSQCITCGSCTKPCPTGARVIFGSSMTACEVMAKIVHDRIFFEQSNGGVTFSGGEPTAQPEFLDELLTECRREGIPTAIDTCGSVARDTLIYLAKKADLILYDLKGCNEERHLSNTGVTAAPLLENLDALAQIHDFIWIRVPIVPGYTDEINEMELLASRYNRYKSIKRVVLLPYHSMGDTKLLKMGKKSKLSKILAPDPSLLDTLAEVWKHSGYNTCLGG